MPTKAVKEANQETPPVVEELVTETPKVKPGINTEDLLEALNDPLVLAKLSKFRPMSDQTSLIQQPVLNAQAELTPAQKKDMEFKRLPKKLQDLCKKYARIKDATGRPKVEHMGGSIVAFRGGLKLETA